MRTATASEPAARLNLVECLGLVNPALRAFGADIYQSTPAAVC
jgi:hypothetical protein